MEETVEKKASTRKVICSVCAGKRNCEILGHHKEGYSDENYDWHKNWYLLMCKGCEHVFVQTVSASSEDYHHFINDYGQDDVFVSETIHYWPALAKRKKPNWLEEISNSTLPEVNDLEASLNELYTALDNDLNMLSGIGIRTCFDKASESLGIDPDLSFKKKLSGLVDAGHIGVVDQKRLETLVDAGSASAHRGWKPSAEDLNTMMDVLEHFLETAFIVPMRKDKLDKKLTKVKGKVPQRAFKKAVNKKSAILIKAKPSMKTK